MPVDMYQEISFYRRRGGGRAFSRLKRKRNIMLEEKEKQKEISKRNIVFEKEDEDEKA